MKCNEATQGYCANADQDGNCHNVDCEAYREDTVKHTDGPWEVVQSAAGTTVKHAATKQPIASIWGNSQANAYNARLIAAAPDLLDTLKMMVRAANRMAADPDPIIMFAAIEKARAAIAKAEGEED